MTAGNPNDQERLGEENKAIVDALRAPEFVEALGAAGLIPNQVKHLSLGVETAVVYPAKKLETADDVIESGYLQQVWDVVEDLQNQGMPNEEIKKFLHGVADGIEDN